jgi:hypothetical protein
MSMDVGQVLVRFFSFFLPSLVIFQLVTNLESQGGIFTIQNTLCQPSLQRSREATNISRSAKS